MPTATKCVILGIMVMIILSRKPHCTFRHSTCDLQYLIRIVVLIRVVMVIYVILSGIALYYGHTYIHDVTLCHMMSHDANDAT